MSRKKMTLLSVAAAVMLAGVLMSNVWFAYFAGRTADISLPPPLAPDATHGPAVTGPDFSGSDYTPLVVDKENIQTILKTVERPDAYRLTAECSYYWPGGEETVRHTLAHRGQTTRIETRQGSEPVQNRIVINGLILVWTGDGMTVHEISPEDADAEAFTGVPTWEDVAAFPPESVLEAEYRVFSDGARCLYVKTQESVYQVEYIVSLETGLLVSAVFTGADGRTAYQVKIGHPVIGDPGDEWFALPGGRVIE
jgi:hypothetical protein